MSAPNNICDLSRASRPQEDQFFVWAAWAHPCFTDDSFLCSPRKLRQSLTLLFPGVAFSQYTSGYGIVSVLLSSKSGFYYLSIPTQHPPPPIFSTSLLALQQAEVECPVVSVFSPSVEKKEVFCVVCSVCCVLLF